MKKIRKQPFRIVREQHAISTSFSKFCAARAVSPSTSVSQLIEFIMTQNSYPMASTSGQPLCSRIDNEPGPGGSFMRAFVTDKKGKYLCSNQCD